MRLSFFTIKKLWRICLSISLIVVVILSNCVFLSIFHVHAQSSSYYDQEIELEYGVSTQLSEVSVPSSNIFESYGISGFSLSANFSNNNGTIWINDINNETIWSDQLNETIEIYINVNNTSIKQYRLWANSSTSGNNTLYYTFRPDIIHAGNWGIIVVIIFIPIIIIVAIIIGLVRKKESRSVRFATKIGERMAIKYQNKYQERLGKFLNKKHKNIELKLCPKCGFKIKDPNEKYCSECGFMLTQ